MDKNNSVQPNAEQSDILMSNSMHMSIGENLDDMIIGNFNPDVCQVKTCSQNVSGKPKYKCPRCFIKYCSIGCWNEHTTVGCLISSKKISTLEEKGALQTILFPTDDSVNPKDLEKLRNDKELRTILGNPALRDILSEVDKAKNVRQIMQQAMLEPIFVEFADKCLSVIEPEMEDE